MKAEECSAYNPDCMTTCSLSLRVPISAGLTCSPMRPPIMRNTTVTAMPWVISLGIHNQPLKTQ